jgi:dolichyl-phosphate beta-glucosyltransferase
MSPAHNEGRNVKFMKTLSIVIPVYNEEKRVHKAFTELKKLRLPHGLKLAEVIFVNDGSTDTTESRIMNYESSIKRQIQNTKYKILSYKKNRGKGYAVRMGMKTSSADYALLCDADMSVPLADIALFGKAIFRGDAVIVGTRKTGRSAVIKHQPLYRELLGRAFTKISQLTLGTNVSDFTCGFKLFSRNARNTVFTKSVIDRWGYDAEIILLAEKEGFEITEIPVSYLDDRGTRVNLLTAIPQTTKELMRIVYTIRLKPALHDLEDALLTLRLQTVK